MIAAFQATLRKRLAWRDPLAVANGLRDRDGLAALLSDGAYGRRSWVSAEPDHVHIGPIETLSLLDQPALAQGVIGLLAYDAGARVATGPREQIWPDLMLARYPAMLAFDHDEQTVTAIGRGVDTAAAEAVIMRAEAWLADAVEPIFARPPAQAFAAEAPDQTYLSAVADVVERIAAGDLFQANIARVWSGTLHPDAQPFAVLARLAGRASAYGAYLRLGDRALVSNSPELFLAFDAATRRIETRPIKGTRPRDPDPARDADLAADLAASAKDRAENLMIVDLMRNDLSRVAEPGSVHVRDLFDLERHPTVHHLVSTVEGTARADVTPARILAETFPPGSITGAPKHQAMKVIAAHEAPRGPWCGSLFRLDDDGLTASVLIRTASFEKRDGGWSFRTLAGAGIVADSDPASELAETEAKIRAMREALVGA